MKTPFNLYLSFLKQLVKLLQKQKLKYLQVGDKVESKYNDKGEVILVYRDIRTNAPVGCAIRWNKEVTPGSNISVNVSPLDKGNHFNPQVRKIASK